MEDLNFMAIGPRTGKNILKGRNIRKNEMGGDVFEDYWTDSEDETSSNSTKSACKLAEVDTNRDSSNVACEEQQRTVCFDESPIEEASINIEASNSNKMHLENPVPASEIPIRSTSPLQNGISKSHLCNSRKSSINPKYAAKLKHYDELDMQIMQMFNEADQMREKETSTEKPVSLDSEHITKEMHPLDKCSNNGENEDDGISEGCRIYNSSPKAHKKGKIAVNKKNEIDENPPFSNSAEHVQDKIISDEIGETADESQSEDGNDLGLVDKNEALNSGEKEGSEIDERGKEVAMRNNSFEELFISQSVHENSNFEEGVKSDFMNEASASPIECSSKDANHCVNQTYEVQNPLTTRIHKKRRETVKNKNESDQIPPLNIESKNNNQNIVSDKEINGTGVVEEKDSSDKCSSSDESGDDSVSQTQKAHNSLNLNAHKKVKRTVNNRNECDHPLSAEDHLENLSLNTSLNVSQGRQYFGKTQAMLNSGEMVESETAGKKQGKVVKEKSHIPDSSPHGPSNVNEEPHNNYSRKDESGDDNVNRTYDSHNSLSAKSQKKRKRAVKNRKQCDQIRPLGAEDQLEDLCAYFDREVDCTLSNVRSSKPVFDKTQALLNSVKNVEPETGTKNKNIIVKRKSSVLHKSPTRNKNITYQKENIESSAIKGMNSSDEYGEDDDVNQVYNVRNSLTAKSRKRIVNNKRKSGRIHSLNAKDALRDLHASSGRKMGLTLSNGFPNEQLIDKTQAVLTSIEKIRPTIETENTKNASNSSVPHISPNIDKNLTYGKENNKSDSVEETDSSSNERGSENEDCGVHQTNDFHNSKTSKSRKGRAKTVNKKKKKVARLIH